MDTSLRVKFRLHVQQSPQQSQSHRIGIRGGESTETGDKRFGFVQFLDPADAAEAKYQMDGQVLQGRRLTVVFAE
ncbi:serine/arginine-rich SC35-like splicing factor SCL33 [Tanacetum coccineum]|uniref:Serine/arginine-rich SC35-like splicing factor SCL33 n=1 Tax=Tanacetum coccineum TaxID=301880 RepID=A0ABQ5J7Q6_9ASTR